MQGKSDNFEENSIKEMDGLIDSIKQGNKQLREEDLAVQLGYNEGYFSQLRSRGSAPRKFIDRLKIHAGSLQYAKSAAPAAQPEPDHLTKLADAAYLGQKNVERMIAMLEEKDKALKEIQASLALVQPNMLALTAKIQEGQRDIVAQLATKIDELAAGTSRNSKSLPHAQR